MSFHHLPTTAPSQDITTKLYKTQGCMWHNIQFNEKIDDNIGFQNTLIHNWKQCPNLLVYSSTICYNSWCHTIRMDILIFGPSWLSVDYSCHSLFKEHSVTVLPEIQGT